MGNFQDLTGKKYGMLTVLSLSQKGQKDNLWLCRCDCGVEKNIWSRAFKSGSTVSCGCHRLKILNQSTHGMSKTRLYKVWRSMIERCNRPKSKNYRNYAGRGIKVCEEWKGDGGFLNFRKWALDNGYDENAPFGKCTLDRINNDGNYEPSNCRWVDMTIQSNNKRNNHFIEFDGEKHTLSEWARIKGMPKSRLISRLNLRGYTIEEALTSPKQNGWSRRKRS